MIMLYLSSAQRAQTNKPQENIKKQTMTFLSLEFSSQNTEGSWNYGSADRCDAIYAYISTYTHCIKFCYVIF